MNIRLCFNATHLTDYAVMDLGDGTTAVDRAVRYAQELSPNDGVTVFVSGERRLNLPETWNVIQRETWSEQALLEQMSSVSGALRALSGRGLVNYAPYEVVTLTAKGSAAARDVIKRHRILRDFFTRVLAVDENIADKGACEMEHSVPPEILNRFRTFAEFVENCESTTFEWIEGRGFVCEKDDKTERRCAHCESVKEGG